jgi:hypothetical protein
MARTKNANQLSIDNNSNKEKEVNIPRIDEVPSQDLPFDMVISLIQTTTVQSSLIDRTKINTLDLPFGLPRGFVSPHKLFFYRMNPFSRKKRGWLSKFCWNT